MKCKLNIKKKKIVLVSKNLGNTLEIYKKTDVAVVFVTMYTENCENTSEYERKRGISVLLVT